MIPIADERLLLTRYQEEGDEAARDQMVVRYMPLVRQLARRYHRSGESLDDLVQVASLGLVNAIERFDAGRGTAFKSYAVPTIVGELKRYFRDSGWSVHMPRSLQERVLGMDRAVDRLYRELGRSPSVPELAGLLGIAVEEVLEALEAKTAYTARSLEERTTVSEGQGQELGEQIGRTDERFELIEYGATIERALEALPDRDREVMRLRFVEDLTQAEIAERLDISQMHVSRLLRRTLERLRTVAGASEG